MQIHFNQWDLPYKIEGRSWIFKRPHPLIVNDGAIYKLYNHRATKQENNYHYSESQSYIVKQYICFL